MNVQVVCLLHPVQVQAPLHCRNEQNRRCQPQIRSGVDERLRGNKVKTISLKYASDCELC